VLVEIPLLSDNSFPVVQYNPFGDLSTVAPSDNRRVNTNGSLIAGQETSLLVFPSFISRSEL
jgi:hypothetical protein